MDNQKCFQLLAKEILKLEACYGLSNVIVDDAGVKHVLRDMDIGYVVSYLKGKAADLSRDELMEVNTNANKSIIIIAFLSQRLRYNNAVILDFKMYPKLKFVATLLFKFTNKKTVDTSSIKSLNALIELLAQIDELYIKARGCMSYKYLRMFILLILFDSYDSAGVLAELIISQLKKGEES